MQTWNQITKFLTFSDIAATRASAKKMFHGDIGDSLTKFKEIIHTPKGIRIKGSAS